MRDFVEKEITAHGGSFNVGSMEEEEMPWLEFPYQERKS